MVKRQRLSEMIAFRVYPALYKVITDLATKQRRKLSEVELALMERGVAAFLRDGQLFEPDAPPPNRGGKNGNGGQKGKAAGAKP